MATKVNEILPFAVQNTGTNLLTQGEYDTDTERVIGHQPGIARSKLENKVLRQTSIMAAGLAQFILGNQDESVTDSMTAQAIADAMSVAVQNVSQAVIPSFDMRVLTAQPYIYSSAVDGFTVDDAQTSIGAIQLSGTDGLVLCVAQIAYKYTAQMIQGLPSGARMNVQTRIALNSTKEGGACAGTCALTFPGKYTVSGISYNTATKEIDFTFAGTTTETINNQERNYASCVFLIA